MVGVSARVSCCCPGLLYIPSGWALGPLVHSENGGVYPYFPSGSTGRLVDQSNGSSGIDLFSGRDARRAFLGDGTTSWDVIRVPFSAPR